MIIFRKVRPSIQTLNDLQTYFSSLGDEPVKRLSREIRSWGEFSCADLAPAIEDGRLDELIDWQSRYADIVNRILAPQWAAAFAAAAKKATKDKIILNDSDIELRAWLEKRGGELVTLLSDESKRAIANVILHAQERLMNPQEIAQLIRPLIGLNTRQAQATFNYRQKIYQNFLEHRVSEEIAARNSDSAAQKHAASQRYYRAETITHTELAFAYNRGAYTGVIRAINEGLMGKCQMVWTTAGKDRVCARCLALKDTVVGYTDESGVTLPPLHPRCRCTISYREVEAPKPPQSNKPRGLAAGNEIYFDEGGKLPYKVGEIDFNDASQVKQVLDWVEAQIVTAPVENAIIITQSGEIYHCTGGLNTLTTIEELGEKLRGAIVTHNHPIGSANEYSFSEADWNLFKKFNLYRLRGIDEFFIYELNRNATDLDEMEIIIDNYNYKHWDNMRKARNYKYGYRRWRR